MQTGEADRIAPAWDVGKLFSRFRSHLGWWPTGRLLRSVSVLSPGAGQLYNTGARADEVAHVHIEDLTLPQVPGRDLASVLIRGKGNKLRRCPLWAQTLQELSSLIRGHGPTEHVFLNRRGQPITRFGIHTLVERSVRRATAHVESLATKRVSPHVIRHSTATHLLRAGVDINTIRAWLGHVSLATTNVYAEVDL